MFDGNVIYEMNPVGEINVPQEDKKANMNDDGKGKISIATGGSGSAKFYTIREDETGEYVNGAGKDIESIMANGGFTLLTPEENYNQYEWQSFTFNAVRYADGAIVYYFKGQHSPEPMEFEIIGDDLHIGLTPT